ncbi:MAG: DUF3829 domain-containing protein [Polyangiaceae bacterium]
MRRVVVWALGLLVACGGAEERGGRTEPPEEMSVSTASASARTQASAAAPAASVATADERAEDEPPEESSAPPPKLAITNPAPETTAFMRLRGCRMGFVGLRLAREAYLGSLGSKRPGPGAIPGFGVALPANSARATTLPYARLLRNCNVAAALKDAVMDPHRQVVRDAGAAGLDLANTLTLANSYYFKQDYLQDAFQAGSDMHDKLVQGFKGIDPATPPLDAALRALESARAKAAQKGSETRRLSAAATDAAFKLALSLEPKPDMKAFRATTTELGKAALALEAWQSAHSGESDPFVKLGLSPLKSLESKAAAFQSSTPTVEERVELLSLCSRFIETDYRAEGRSLRDKH